MKNNFCHMTLSNGSSAAIAFKCGKSAAVASVASMPKRNFLDTIDFLSFLSNVAAQAFVT